MGYRHFCPKGARGGGPELEKGTAGHKAYPGQQWVLNLGVSQAAKLLLPRERNPVQKRLSPGCNNSGP